MYIRVANLIFVIKALIEHLKRVILKQILLSPPNLQ